MGANRNTNWGADWNIVQPADLLLNQADLTIIVQRSLMNRNDRCAGHHLLDVQGRQRGVQLPEHGKVVEHPLNHGIDQLSWLITR